MLKVGVSFLGQTAQMKNLSIEREYEMFDLAVRYGPTKSSCSLNLVVNL